MTVKVQQGDISTDFGEQTLSAIVIVVNWNSGAMLKRCIGSLLAQRVSFRQIIIVDNQSTDGSADEFEHCVPPVKLVRAGSNLGFAAGCNLGARNAVTSEWIALVNADAVLQADWLEQMFRACRDHPDYQFFSGRQLMAERTELLDGAGDDYHVSGLHWRRGYGKSAGKYSDTQEVFGACAAAALYRADVFREAGGLDESFFCYAEDVDLAFRLRLRGYRCLYVPSAIAHHVGSAVTGKRSDFTTYHGHRNLEWAYFKSMPTPLLWLYLPHHLLLNLIAIFYFTLRGQGWVILRAKWDAIKGLPHVLRQRREIQRTRKVSAWEMRQVMAKGWLTPYLRRLR